MGLYLVALDVSFLLEVPLPLAGSALNGQGRACVGNNGQEGQGGLKIVFQVKSENLFLVASQLRSRTVLAKYIATFLNKQKNQSIVSTSGCRGFYFSNVNKVPRLPTCPILA